jgi:aminoglycoside phosphotransferase (APT) family kinase protein
MRYLLRVSPIALYEAKKSLFSMTEKLKVLNVPMCQPIEMGICNDGVYTLHEWIDGVDLEDVLPLSTELEQYTFGIKAGNILKTIHAAHTPTDNNSWEVLYNRKIDSQLQKYLKCGKRFNGDKYVLRYIKENRHLIGNRPQVYHHGDFSWKNTMLLNGETVIIDFERLSTGCPFEEFFFVILEMEAYPRYATGLINGYFDNNPPHIFFTLLALYTAVDILPAFYEILPNTQNMEKQISRVLSWFDNMTNPVPTWYIY